MKSVFVMLATLAAGGLARAPLLRRDDLDGIADNYIVVMKKNLHVSAVQNHFESMRAKSVNIPDGMRGFVRSYQIEGFNGYHIECDESTLQDIRDHELVEYVSHDGLARPQAPNPPMSEPVGHFVPEYFKYWGLGRISHRLANITTYARTGLQPGKQPSIAYVIDTGIRTTHQEFGGRAIWGANFKEGSQDDDEAGHGTHVAGTIMGETTGVDNTTLAIAVKVFDGDGGPVSDIMAGLNWAVQHARNSSHITRSVANLSLGGGFCQPFNDAVEAAVAAGMTVVVAAGNDGVDACSISPASAPSAITVGGIDRHDNRLFNYGRCVDIFAPGDDIRSSFNRDDQAYAVLGGTSMASPHVAGLAAYLKARMNLKTPKDVWDHIKDLATPNQVINATDGSPNLIPFNGNPVELDI
ncbi:subtilisin-like protease [Xylaria nigripes]|nr:subtilisin-like protease [Xylaria nigripes]